MSVLKNGTRSAVASFFFFATTEHAVLYQEQCRVPRGAKQTTNTRGTKEWRRTRKCSMSVLKNGTRSAVASFFFCDLRLWLARGGKTRTCQRHLVVGLPHVPVWMFKKRLPDGHEAQRFNMQCRITPGTPQKKGIPSTRTARNAQ